SCFPTFILLCVRQHPAPSSQYPGNSGRTAKEIMTDGLHLDVLLAAAVFTGARVSGLMVFCPFLGSDAVPVPVKAGLTLLLTVLLHPLHGPAGLALGSWQWAEVALGEGMIGLMLGLT